MLAHKSFFATINSSTGCTGQNTLYYNPSTKEVKYTTVAFQTINSGTNVSIVESSTSNTNSTTSMTTYMTSDSLPAATYFVTASYNYTGTGGGQMRVELRNNQTSTSFADIGVISIQVTGILAGGSTNGITSNSSSGTVSFRFRKTTGTNVTIRGASLACFRIA